jgi:hypothetical protein
MKKITFLLCLLITSVSFSQVVLEDFEGTAPMTTNFDGISSAVTADPVAPAEKSLQLITAASGQPWQGAKLIMQNNKIDMTTSNKVMTVDIYSNAPREFLAKLADGDVGGADAAQESKTAAAHGGTGWETLTFNFNVAADTGQPGYNPPNDQFSSIVFYPLYDISNNGWCDGCGQNMALATTTYIDNVTGIAGDPAGGPSCSDGMQNGDETGVDCGGASCPTCPAEPTTAAPTPPNRPAADVKSIFSDAYTPIAALNYAGVDGQPSNDNTFNTSWCPGTTSLIQVAGNNTNKVTGLGCEGISFLSGRFDATTFTNFHIDIWTDTPTMDKSFNIKFSNWNNGTMEANALEFSFTNASSPALPSTNPGTWISYDVPFSAFTPVGGSSRNDFVQFVITSDLGTVYYDNLYVHKNTLGVNEFDTASFNVFPNPSKDSWTLKTKDITMSSIQVFDMVGKNVLSLTPNASETVIDGSNLKTGLYFARITTNGNVNTVKLIKN